VLAWPNARFDRLDANHDGFATADEAINGVIKRFEGRVLRHMRGLDANADGKVSREEHAAPALERFDALDANGDGKLTADELPPMMAGPVARPGGWGGPGMMRGMMQGMPDMPDGPGAIEDDGPDEQPGGAGDEAPEPDGMGGPQQ
jgi:hypothetical protein